MQTYGPGGHARRRRFAVTVDGVRHEVIVEELEDTVSNAGSAPSALTSMGALGSIPESSGGGAASQANPSPSAHAESSGENTLGENTLSDGWIDAPMPGTVTEISVEVGARVKAGDVLLILTAMKLENEITSPTDGTVEAIAVAQGDNVNNGDRLVQLGTGGVD